MKIQNTKDTENNYLKILVNGESGAGKTTLAKTLLGKTLVVSAEAGLLSLKGCDIDFIDLSTTDAGVAITDPVMRIARLSDIFKYLQAGTKYQNVFLDSLTEIGELMVQSLYREFPDRKDSMVLWGENSKRMRSIVKSFRDLPYNVTMVTLSKLDKDQSNKRFMGFSIAGALAEQLPQYFDEVFYLHVNEEGVRGLVTRKTDVYVCKDRSGRLDILEPADLGAIAIKILKPVQKEGVTK